ncbi:MFS transporter [Nocardia brevicatena]|uniref:MFS transporter n=1 Tax=Nocardia brevicatena TaxID=37327 RepID=UPI000594DC45|nr:MFS transporter [Nocardia brevicatena]
MSSPAAVGGGIITNRNFLLLWSGNAVSLVGFHGARIAYPLLVLAITGSPSQTGIVTFAMSLPSLIFQIPAGLVADYTDRRRTLWWCQFAGLIATCMALVAAVGRPPGLVLLLSVTAFLEGTANVFFVVSELGVVRNVVSVEQRPAALALLEAELPIAQLIGRAVGATVYGLARWLPFAVNALSYLCCLGALSVMRTDYPARRSEDSSAPRRTWTRIVEGVAVIWSHPFLRGSTAIMALSNSIFQVVILLLLLEIKVDGLPTWTVGLVLGAAGVGGLLGAGIAGPLTTRFNTRVVFGVSVWAWSIALVPIALSSNPYVMALSFGCIGGIGRFVSVVLIVFQVDVIPDHVLGRATAAAENFNAAAVAFGALAGGYLLTAVGIRATGWIMVAAMFVLAVGGTYLSLSRSIRRGSVEL